MLVHAPDIVQDVFVQNFSQLFVLDIEESKKKLNSLNRVKNIFCSQNHNWSNTFFTSVRMQIWAMILK